MKDKAVLPTMFLGHINEEEVCIEDIIFPYIKLKTFSRLNNSGVFTMYLYMPDTAKYKEFYFENWCVVNEEKSKYGWRYMVKIYDVNDLNLQDVQILISQTLEFATCLDGIKFGNFNNSFKNSKLIKYPIENDRTFPENYIETKKKWLDILLVENERKAYKELESKYELAFNADRPVLYTKILNNGVQNCFRHIITQDGLSQHPIFARVCQRVVIGNEFCINLFPSLKQLEEILKVLVDELCNITVAYPLLLNLTHLKNVLGIIDMFSKKHRIKIEFLVNDWGTLNVLYKKKYENIVPVLGRLVNKRPKDVRFKWKWNGLQYKDMLTTNYLNCDISQKFLEKYGVERYSFEDHWYINEIPNKSHSLYFPFYQINTAPYCHLYDDLKKFDVNNTHKDCPRICNYIVQVFPEHLTAVERGNTVYGFSSRILSQPGVLADYLNKGIDRLIYTIV